MDKASITGKLLLLGQLVLKSPLIVGSGFGDEEIDITVLKDSIGMPYVPATSLAGVLRHYFFNVVDIKDVSEKQLNYFWGSDKWRKNDNKYQSAFFLSELTTSEQPTISVRDGIKIGSNGIAVDKGKFDYEIVEPGAKFNFKIEVNLRQDYDKELFKRILAFLVSAMENREIMLGAMTTKGFGRCELDYKKYYELDFTKKKDVIAWLKNSTNELQEGLLDVENVFTAKNNDFYIDVMLEIKSSLIIRSYSGDPQAPDAVHIHSNNKPVLTGTSIKGAIRNRAEYIINTLGGNSNKMVKELMGWADDRGKSKEKYKSRVIVEETKIDNAVPKIQNRIKIDRFTGGTIKTALFNTTPLWPVESGKNMVQIRLTVKQYKDWEVGLLLLLLKDLWSGDLPVGGEKNIGRGLFKGVKADISYEDKVVKISQQKDGLKIDEGNVDELESFINAFNDMCRGKEASHD
ncbi:MAG: hypothetical protein K9L17_01080 [Clostridiales bacterium]|nr:hypothetical protein [Clostridiales bacterium]MCF8021286.1 hypothetical protein [Clostridiales bacterium]